MVISKKAVLSVSLFALLLWGVVLSTFANPPTSPYGVSQNIVDPACAPNSLNCYVASLSIGDTVGNNPDLNGILYTDANSQVITDDQFTRDSVTHETVIGQDFTVSVDTVDVTLSVVIFMDPNDVSGPFSQGDSIVGATSGATATVDYYNNTNGFGYFSNVVGDFQQGETINNITSGAISIAGQTLEHDSFVVDDTINFYSPGSQSIIGTGVVTAVSGNTATIRVTGVTTVPAQYDLVLDSVQGGTKLWGMTSFAVNSNPETRYGQFSTGTILGFFQGIGLTYSDNGSRYATQVVGGVVGGDAYVTGSLVGDSSINNYATIFQNLNGVGSSPSIEMGTVDALNNHNTNVLLNRSRIVLQANEEVALLASRVQIGGYDYNNDDPDNHFYPAYSTYYYLPTTRGTAGQVLTDDGNGNVTWETVSGGSLPDQGGHGGEFLTTDGVTASWAAASSLLEGYTNGSATALGVNATGGQQSAVFGNDAGNGASYNNYSTIIGSSAGTSGNIDSSVLIGLWSGQSATAIDYSVAIGYGVGSGVDVIYSNFIGATSGQSATNAFNSNFFGYQSGAGATNAAHSIFIGNQAGYIDTVDNTISGTSILIGDNTSTGGFSNSIALGGGGTNTAANQFLVDDSYTDWSIRGINYVMPSVDAAGILTSDGTGNLSWETALIGSTLTLGTETWLGYLAGDNSASTVDTVFIGEEAGSGATAADQAIIIGKNAGIDAVNAYESVFLGFGAGIHATNANDSNFFGQQAGGDATNAQHSNFFGLTAGNTATNADFSNFIGSQAGFAATNADNSNFLGQSAGQGATGANNSNFLGYFSGYNATAAQLSNFLGNSAGHSATNAYDSNFFGTSAGYTATNADDSNFIGSSAGYAATNASYSNFFGYLAGYGATDAANSIFIGRNAGYNDTVDNTASVNDFSILIGKSTSTGGFSNSIAIGGSATNTASNQFMIGSATRPIDTTRINGSSSTQCTITTGTGIACTSDERVKTNITDLTTDTLDKLLNVKTVTYNWLQNPTSKTQIGFLAQDLEQYFPELVETDSVGMRSVYYAQMTPILVEAIREMNLKITTINDVETPNTWRDSLIAWFGNASNKITRIFTGELCLYDENGQTECINASQLRELKQSQNIQNQNTPQPPTVDIPPTEEPPSENTPPPTEEPPVVEPT